MTTQTLYGAYTSGLFTTLTGTRSYMSIGSSAGATHQRPAAGTDGNYPFEVGIATIPQIKKDSPKVISQGPSEVQSSGSSGILAVCKISDYNGRIPG